MNKTILSPNQVRELVAKNKYKVDSKKKFLSRCIDGRYANEPDLPALAFPGADVGELALVFATGKSYGFEVDREKVFKSLIEVIGGEKNFRMHTDHHTDPKTRAGGCGHFKQIILDAAAYSLGQDDVDFIKKCLERVKKKGAWEIVLDGDHVEGAVLMITGGQGVYPQYNLETDNGSQLVEVFIYHQSLVDERHRVLASTLLRNKAVKLYSGCDEDWLYQSLSEMSENHLLETAKRLAKGLPIYQVKFKDDGQFEIKEQGIV